MTRQRKGLRPLSQTGLIRVPMNPSQRNFLEGGAKAKRTVLAAFNERSDDRQLHPTKGWRNLNVKRTRAQMLLANIFAGRSMSTTQMANFLADRVTISAA